MINKKHKEKEILLLSPLVNTYYLRIFHTQMYVLFLFCSFIFKLIFLLWYWKFLIYILYLKFNLAAYLWLKLQNWFLPLHAHKSRQNDVILKNEFHNIYAASERTLIQFFIILKIIYSSLCKLAYIYNTNHHPLRKFPCKQNAKKHKQKNIVQKNYILSFKIDIWIMVRYGFLLHVH